MASTPPPPSVIPSSFGTLPGAQNVNRLAASVGHELRNPLAAVRAAHYYVHKQLESSGMLTQENRLGQFLGVMDVELRTMEETIRDLLEFAGERPPTPSACPLPSLIEDALHVVRMPPHVRFETRIDPTFPILQVDREMFRRVLAHLIENGAEAIEPGQEGSVTVHASVEDRHAVIRVVDTGRGMTESEREKIFQPLFTTKIKGTGLGLAIVRSFVVRHGAEIECDSAPDQGTTTFSIRIPLA